MLPAFKITGEEMKVSYWRTFQRERMKFASSVAGHVYTIMRRQLNVIATAVEGATSQTVVQQVAEEAITATEPMLVGMYDRVYIAVGTHFAGEVYSAMAKAAGRREVKAEEGVIEGWKRRILEYVQRIAGRRIVSIQETTLQLVRQAITDGINEGLGMQKLASKLRSDTTLRETYRNRSLVVARTEVIAASNFGSQQGARSTGLTLTKEWLATRDGRTREDHAAADGQKIGMDFAYTVGGEALQFPGDPAGSPENVINCRCTEVYAPVA